jgi:hypothetical protein
MVFSLCRQYISHLTDNSLTPTSKLHLKKYLFYHFYIYLHVYTLFGPPPRSSTLLDRTCSILLFNDFGEEKQKIIRKTWHFLVSGEWIKKMWYLYTMEFYSVTKKNEILSFSGTRMELENIILSEVSQAYKAKNHIFSIICRL